MSAQWGADTNLDAIASQVRARPPLQDGRLEALLAVARREPHGSAFNTIVEHHLGAALSAAIDRADRGIDVVDLFQDGCIAVVVALEEFTARAGAATDLAGYVDTVVALHLEAAIEREAAEVTAEQQLVRDAETLQAARTILTRDLGRPPTDLELGGLLQWPPERVESVTAALRLSEERYDADILQYLDDLDEGGQDHDSEDARERH